MEHENAQVPATMEKCIQFALRGHAPAVECFMLMRDVLHFWDDLIDGDVTITNEYINRSMFKAMVDLPSNSFYREHQAKIAPIVVNAFANWHAATEFERNSDDRRLLEVAFIIRSDYANLLIHFSYLIGGYQWMTHVTPMIRGMWTDEDFESYLGGLERERVARIGRHANGSIKTETPSDPSIMKEQ